MREDRESPIQRMRRGAGVFLRSFGIFTILILAMWLVGGPEPASRGVPIRVDLLTLIYPGGAAITGALFALFEPAADRSRVLAMAVGIIAIAPWVAGITLTFDRGYASWNVGHTIVTAITSLTLGCAMGYGYSRNQ
jgi:hypothetical protein